MKRHKKISKDLSKKFRKFRKDSSLSLRDIEKMTSMTNPFISQFERGIVDISYGRGIVLIELMQEYKFENN